jgi:hypothetical protein
VGLDRLDHLPAIGWGRAIGALQLARLHQSGPGVSIKLDLVESAHGTVHKLYRADRAGACNCDGGVESDTLADLEYSSWHLSHPIYGAVPYLLPAINASG